MSIIINFFACFMLCFFRTTLTADFFSEDLQFHQLDNDDVLVVLSTEQSTEVSHHHTKFPPAISALASTTPFHSIEIHSTQGHWEEWKWGGSPFIVHPHGMELVAWVDPRWTENSLPSLWKSLLADLSALLCSSLEYVAYAENVVFTDSTALPFPSNYSRVMAFLPREPVCVENLTPWIKLLPCKGKKGLSSIFKSQAFFRGVFHGLHSQILKTEDEARRSLVFSQRLEVVFKSNIIHHRLQFEELLSSSVFTSCPVSDSTLLSIDIKLPLVVQDYFTNSSVPQEPRIGNHDASEMTSYRLEDCQKDYQFALVHKNKKQWDGEVCESGFSAQSYLTKSRGNDGSLMIDIRSPSSSSSTHERTVCLLQSFPWTVRVWFHSLQIWQDGQKVYFNKIRNHFNLQVSEDRKAPSVLDVCLELEHPPDAYRGVDIPPTVVYIFNESNLSKRAEVGNHFWALSTSSSSSYSKIYGTGSLVHLLVPDFSMPYNVCALTSTVLALYFGVMMKLLCQPTDAEAPEEDKRHQRRAKLVLVLMMVIVLGIYYDIPTEIQQFLSL